ncbi:MULTISPECIES: cytochrome-c oxidase, cbb3-type subunit III [Rhodomicrobium]|uniref:cytochrome-c oxidase, cbb3-type subunit III n=1 Tax=Rhodomicrobium TaxID=1068 RepID=UPI000B4B636C|nr:MULTISPECIES: cytochrome-c oxidase, cbb3-type subunit III [Rhodomicrobium]
MDARPEIDSVTGAETTGHEWDGIKELNQPLPKWWLYVLYACIVWSIGYWVAYPAWPLISGYTRGLAGYSQRETVGQRIAEARAAQGQANAAIAKASVEEIQASPDLLQFAMAGGRAAFGDNCAPCHGRGAQGAKGYPNLNDDDWLWGGKLADIQQTVLYGIRSTAGETRASAMPRFGQDQILERGQISDLAEQVLALSGNPHDAAAAERAKPLFADNCAACHGETGKGNRELGAPDLTDAIWLYGGAKADIVRSIETGRGGVMPAWAGRLDAGTIKKLTVYVHSLGGGQ